MSGLRVVAIDGVLGAGKTTVARRLAERLGLDYLDTGAMYRSIGVACLRRGFAIADATALEGTSGDDLRAAAIAVAREAAIEVQTSVDGTQTVTLEGVDITDAIRAPESARAASVIATIPEVRTEMVERQRAWARTRGGGVLEGRDIATVVFPDAPVQVFLTADVEERARRRHAEQPDQSFDDVVADLRWRDHNDSSRDVAPLSVADRAVVIDTTGMSLDAVVDRAVEVAEGGFRSAAVADGLVEAAVHPPSESDTDPSPFATSPVATSPQSAAPTPTPADVPVVRTGADVSPVSRADRILWNAVRVLVVGVAKLYFRATWEGHQNLPATGAYILAPVHRSNIDTVVLPVLSKRRIRFLGKVSMWKIGWIGQIFTRLGAIKVERGTPDREAMSFCLDALRTGEPIVVYPEGTRKEGPVVEDLFDGVAWMAAKTQVPIVPVGIAGSAAAMGRGMKFPRPARVHMIVGPPLPPPATTGRSKLRATTSALQTELQRLFDEAQSRRK